MSTYSERYLASILAHASDALVSIDESGTVLSWSAGAERVFGRSPDEVIGGTVEQALPGLSFPWLAGMLEGRERADLGELRIRRPDGTWSYVEVSAAPVCDADGRVAAYSLIARDVSARRAAALARQRDEAERHYLLQREQAARAQAEAASVAKDEFLSVLSHELRTPLSTIAGWAELLHSGDLEPEETKDAVATILRNAQLQRRLVEDLLDVSRIVAGRLRLVLEPVDLLEPVQAAITSVEPAARAKQIQLTTSCSAGGIVRGDAARLTQIASNLLSNAIKFTPRGGHVEVVLRVERERAELVVRDDGEGIAPEHMPRLFDRFWMADATNTRAHGGLGLGLAIVRYLVDRHGGCVRAASEGLGRGAVFTVTLPLARVADDALRN